MRKSVTSFVCGLIGSLFCLGWGFFAAFIMNIAGAISASIDGTSDATITLVYVLGWLCFIGAIFGIVGASNCFKKARVGAIWLTIATVMCAPLHIYIFVQIPSIGGAFIFSRIVVVLLPVILLAVATVFAWLAKKVNKPMANSYEAIANAAQSDDGTSKLEKELTKLKETFDKGIITEEEYNAARKKIIEKNT